MKLKPQWSGDSLNSRKSYDHFWLFSAHIDWQLLATSASQGTPSVMTSQEVLPEENKHALGFDVAAGSEGEVAEAAVGIETGPGAFVSGAVGGIIFGVAGYLGATWLTDYLQE
ncbi:hypothetical protein K5D34_00425 [Pseudomonas cichorii]|nr:hypothetical protein [Pseudomonas cichorii]MBX8489861.1 hypothetical protein [Pseudomonas cichorii]MBX8508155.1 hypothetical protein [Pseudomonas cichorii]MBX8519196.1 hypothetical protein [Pseudomonas cichorii]MBX8526230.1 hypothetical protein [Pseudomonas cichorii]MBX8538634.1 hypothetical protein [Pseudomonas cichorii]